MNRMYEFLPFEKAKLTVRSDAAKHGINSERKWQYQKKYLYKRPFNIPYNPQITYKDSGWISWADWLGTNNIRGQLKKYTVNHDFFKKWSHDMAYVLGFWWADGHIRKRIGKNGYGYSYGFGICQNDRDQYILRTIMDCMGANNPVWQPKSRPHMCHFEISSKNIFDDIVKLGGVPKKSLVAKFPKIPKKYFSDFFRGFFDGDGSISISAKNHSASCYVCSGSEAFLSELQKHLRNNHNVHGRLFYSGTCFRLSFGMDDTVKLYSVMYYDGHQSRLRLERKYDKFNSLISYRRQKYGI